MQEAVGTIPTEETKPMVEKKVNKEINISSLTLNQRMLLRGGLKDALMESPAFTALGNQQKIIFYDICNMMVNDKSIQMLDIVGEEFWKKIDVPNQRKKEDARFVKFKFDYVVPGTSQKLSVIKEWRYEDFTP